MSSDSPWIWDPNRQQYYYPSTPDGCYIFADGSRIAFDTRGTAPRNVPPFEQELETAGEEIDASQDDGNRPLNEYEVTRPSQRTDPSGSISTSYSSHPSGSAISDPYMTQQNYAQQIYGRSYFPTSSADEDSTIGPPTVSTSIPANVSEHQGSSKNRGADSSLGNQIVDQLRKLSMVEKLDKTMQNKADSSPKLDPRFLIQKKPHKFFIPGRVFRTVWAEMAGKPGQNTITRDPRFGEKFITKIKWFVVVQSDELHCLCLPINTFSERGVTRKDLLYQYSIIDTARDKPKPLPSEIPDKGQRGMMKWIRVTPAKSSEKMKPQSRLCYTKVYTIEHYYKVHEFGMVHEGYMERLVNQWLVYVNIAAQENTPEQLPVEGEDVETDEEEPLDENQDGDEDENEDDDENELDEPPPDEPRSSRKGKERQNVSGWNYN